METVRLVNEQDLPPDLEAAIRQTLVACFPKDTDFFSHSRAWHGSAPTFSAVVLDGKEVIAHLGVVQREVTIGGAPANVAGIQNVAVLPDHRGRGLCRAMLTAAMDEAKQRGLDYGILFCVADSVPLYARCGWKRLFDSPVVRVDLDGMEKPLVEGNLPMWLPLEKGEFPTGEVHLAGNDW
jgi:predicted N-acetyltransferase YhbS